MLPDTWWVTIHERLTRGDPTATAELAEQAFGLLRKHLARKFPLVRDRDCFDDAAAEALISYMKCPGAYDPAKRRLRGYLEMAAEADLLNILAKEGRRRRRERRDRDVELAEIPGKESLGTECADSTESRKVLEELATIFANPLDRGLAVLVVDGERSTAKFAAMLDIAHLPLSEQRKIVKRHKDRIKKILQRRGRNQHG